jgi:hypothetical protein
MIESVLSTFLPRYAERFPNVHGMMRHMPGHWREMFLPLIADRSDT